jgi:hypothetical protein
MKTKKRNYSSSNRRQWARLEPSAVPFLKSVTFSQGSEVQVVNISRGGILLETEVRLRPQMKIMLKLVTDEVTVKIQGRILRSAISSLQGIPLYRSAIAFDHPFDMLDNLSSMQAEGTEDIKPEFAENGMIDIGSDWAQQPDRDGSQCGEDSALLTVIAKDGTSLQEMFKLNDW